VSRHGGALFAQATGDDRRRLHATSTRDFTARGVGASCTFEVDDRGKVTGVVLHQGGRDVRAARR
jgi:hypothetical protein